jgi:RNA polymerase sigma-32 factor
MAKKKTKSKSKKVLAEVVEDSSASIRVPEVVDETAPQKRVEAEIVESLTETEVSTKLPALSDGLSYYIEAIQKYPLLSKEEEIKIAKRYHETRDPKDAEILVTANLRFVVKVAAEYSQFGSKLIDLIQEGNVGLMHAVKEFNPYKGARLITYAVWWIKGYIQDYLMKQHSMVKIGTTHNQRKLFYNLEKEKAKIDQMGMEPTVKLLSDRLGVPEKDVAMMEKRMSGKDVSLDLPVGEEGSASLLDFEESPVRDITEQLIENESVAQLKAVLGKLKDNFSEKEMYILENRLLNDEPLKLQQIGDEWGVSREAVRQMEARLLKKIKKEMIPES